MCIRDRSVIEDIEKRITAVEEATKRASEEARIKEEQRKTLIVGYAADPVVLDTVESTHMHDVDVMVNMIETLVRPKAPDFAEIEPLLATSWEASPDSMVWTFHLRQGVKFHDGTDFNAQAVKYNFDRVMAAKHYEVESIEKVEVVDDYTVRFTLKEPFAPFLVILTFPSLSIVSPTAIETMGEEIMRHPVGTGPFIFDHWDEGIEVVLRANKDYWGGPPKLDKIVFKIIPEASTRRMELEAGHIDIDYAYDARLTDMPVFMKNPDLEVQGVPGQCSRYIGMNHAKAPFNNKLVRQAIAYAIDYDSIVEKILVGFGERLYCAVLPNFFASAQNDRNLIHYLTTQLRPRSFSQRQDTPMASPQLSYIRP